MKTLRVGFVLLGVALLILLAGGAPQAFHSGGVAECGGCHSMHAGKNSVLLIGTDPSSTCLTCHENSGFGSYHISTPLANMPVGTAPIQRTPGGDFGWLRKTYSGVIRNEPFTEDGATHGHNIVAADLGFVVDPTNSMAPGGGTYPASQLGCQSCHDPHGRARRLSDGTYANAVYTGGATNAPIIASGSYNNSVTPAAGQAVGVYRLLRGLGDNSQGVTFNGIAIAVAPSTYNQSEVTNQVRVAYGTDGTNTWGNWCGTCHPDMKASVGANHTHPIDVALGTTVAGNYNTYVKSGDLTGTLANSFTSLVPFAEATGTISTLQSHASNSGGYQAGPSSSDQVTCVSCHRAHASGWPEALRWNMEGEFMIYNSLYPGTDSTPDKPQFARGRLAAETAAAYYDRPVTTFASYQRVLCNKCHAKD